jgi:hypothetical protein
MQQLLVSINKNNEVRRCNDHERAKMTISSFRTLNERVKGYEKVILINTKISISTYDVY